MLELNTFDAMKIGLASPEKIRSWSRGEVKKPETINYRTLKPERDGLFCERIFGPVKDWECNCGKYKRIKYKGNVCEKCGVEITKSKVRRERMGHIELVAPVSHIWYFKGIPSRMGLILDMSPRGLEKILYFANYVVLDAKDTDLYVKQLLTESEYEEACDKYGEENFRVGMGAEAVKELLQNINLDELSEELKSNLADATGQKKIRLSRRLEVCEAFRKSGNRPEWMVIDVVPVIPPDLRPMVQLEGGRFATSDLNDLYRRVINRNNRLKKLIELHAPEIIMRNEKRMLQEAVDTLIDNGRHGKAVTGAGNRELKSLSDMLKGKTGRFRQNLLGKRVDYSGRSVIVVGPDLKFHQCGLPKKMALELFKPFIMKQLVEDGVVHNIKSAKKYVERLNSRVWDILDKVIKDHPVLLNRAPTLHRLGIQAFEPVLVEGKAIKLHPLVCTAYNADFDGDQMAVHLPLSTEAQAEARLLMLSTNNILAPKDGKPITTPTQDMVLGSYYLTSGNVEDVAVRSFMDYDEMFKAYSTKSIKIHDTVNILYRDEDTKETQIVKSTVGRFIFNEHIPQDLGFVDRNKDKFSLEIDRLVDKKMLGKIVDKCFRKHGNIKTAEVLDYIKATGYKYSTIGAISISMNDVIVPEEKWEILKEAEEKINVYEDLFRDGFVSEQERYEYVISVWSKATEDITKVLVEKQNPENSISIMADSGARGNINQIRQLAGMRGLMSSATGRTVEIPIKSNFREGLSVQEFFISTHGSRKGLSDTALRTADSGYLTRRLVDVSQDVIVREDDCCTDEYVVARDFKDGNAVVEKLADRIVGRHSFEDVLNPNTGELLIRKNEMITEILAEKVEKLGIKELKVRSVLGCKAKHGVCAKCYGRNLATGNPVNIGEAVGIIAAQSIGEPGTQLTMRTFHSGGIAGVGITQGLPRVEELFEARKPKGLAYITEIDGTVKLVDNKKRYDIVVTAEDGDERIYAIPYGARIKVKDGEVIKAGDMLTEGSVNPHDILAIKGPTGVQEYITKEVQKVYRNQGVDIDDRHIEIIIKQMLSKVRIETSGDSNFLEGSLVPFREVELKNRELLNEDKQMAEYDNVLLGITKASLATESFLSAASFQETTRVLTDASIKGKADGLLGLKENVILGKLIPAGTGMKVYKSIEIDYENMEEEDRELQEAKEESYEKDNSEINFDDLKEEPDFEENNEKLEEETIN
ncbi:MAG: DNA-directed RNA polymerase subunit beta' [Peptoniphilaceae bacterium]|uniref:DNA-directed RNA polymerase subunit beta' n=1 Tax=Parvimonas sp. TaxID=1944660 RepID=UPI0025D2543D|nr:DNA-directed RNA polymerase subunit beta' [Parvimonas sp.]MDD7764169.1 DNA-directed RNA polymerase subunit beta' [Peptoniphilaceae bacterium]MDY3050374.1 DNA-directed RNA polymerase subunit beta' [Parvimonas sp.]